MHTTQDMIRGIPERVDELLRRRAKGEGKSLNRAALEALARGLDLTEEQQEFHDLDDLAGTWVADPEFDRAIEEMDRVDPDLWE